MTFVAALPILLALLLLVGFRWPAIVAMPICAGITAISAYWLWRVRLVRIFASMIDAIWVTASILLILFGALFFLALLRQTGAIAVLQRSVGGMSADARIQAVVVGWTLGSFLEGGAGFGTPAAITAPLLIGLGFRPLLAVVVALVGDSTAVSFGAVRTPMIIGMGQGLNGAEGAPAVAEIARRISTLDLFLGALMPVIVVMTL
ncbi:MAG: L-lactate permease, partial [Planctomycetales bacterium]|nr:L-lactate permease [Planctomycetales bacterium]